MATSPTDRERWRRIESILDEVLEMPEDRQGAFLDQTCGDDAELRQAIEKLLLADRGAGTFLEHPAAEILESSDSLLEGLSIESSSAELEGRKVGPYQLRRLIGRGGMGVVYEAEDTRLQRPVAVKFLPRQYTRDAAAKERFRREARAASALDHPSICTIHDIGESDEGQLYFVMSYYRGETLQQRLERGSLSVEEARRIAVQVARGLRHAHRAGITHRDIKPSNVILTEEGGAKILDFGIARVGGASDLTRTGASVGTPAYMSPEQSRGEATDARSDLWSLGVMLYQMLAGRRPFAGDSALAVMNAIATQAPEPLTGVCPDVPTALTGVVDKLLQKEPGARYTSADELLSDFDSGEVLATPAPRQPAEGRRRLGAGAVAVLVLLALGLPWAVPTSRDALVEWVRGAAKAEQRLVAVLPFVNSLEPTGENQALAAGLTHSITGLVAQLGEGGEALWVVPASEVVRQGVTSAAEANRSFGVDTVLTGSVQRVGTRTEVLLSLVDPTVSPPRTVDSRAVTAPLSPELRTASLEGLGELLGVSATLPTDLAIDGADTTSPAAYALYLQGIGYRQRLDQAGNLDAAIESFRGALSEDPLFGSAHAALCEALWDQFRAKDEPALSVEALESCNRAAELGRNQASILVSVGRSFLEYGLLERAAAELERALELEPDNAEAHRWSGWLATEEGQPERAEAAMRRAVELEPEFWVYSDELGQMLIDQSRFEEAIVALENCLRLTPKNPVAYSNLGVAHMELNQVRRAEELFLRSIDLSPTALAYRNLGYMRFSEQRYDESVEMLEAALELKDGPALGNDWFAWVWLGHARFWAGSEAAARDAWRRLIEIALPLYEVNPKNPRVLMALCDAHVALGEHDRGRFYQNRLLALSPDTGYFRYYLGRTYEIMGDRELALTFVIEALEKGFNPLTAEHDPWLEELRSEPEYQALRQRFLPAGEQP